MNPEPQFLACPFCGGKDAEVMFWRTKKMVSCNSCGATGPWFGRWDDQLDKSTEQAVEGWNQRSADAAPLKILRLTLKREWFEMIASGKKREEYREPKQWIFSRLLGKEYHRVEFSNGYGKNVPKITVEYLGWHQGTGLPEWGASEGRDYVVIRLGNVISSENAGAEASPDKL